MLMQFNFHFHFCFLHLPRRFLYKTRFDMRSFNNRRTDAIENIIFGFSF